MRRRLAWLSAAWLCGACSSGGGGGFATPGNGGSSGAMEPEGGGAAASSQGGSAAVDPLAPPLTVESISPADGASGVPLDAVVEISFSAPLDVTTVTESAVVVQGPTGPLEGELTVEGDVVRFAPAQALPLLTAVRVSIGTGLVSSEGGVLADPVEAEFSSRDGAFREPVQINAGGAVGLSLRGNDTGDLVAAWTDLQVLSSVEAMVFDGDAGTWTEAQLIESDDALAFTQPVAAVAPNGDSIVAWRGGGWARYAGSWGAATVAAGFALPSLALGESAALSASNADGNAAYQMLLAGSSEWTEAQPLLTGGRVDAIEALGSGFIAVGTREGSLVAGRLNEPEGAWSEFETVAAITSVDRVRLTTHGDAAAVAWVDVREGAGAEGEQPGPVPHPAVRVLSGGAWSEPLELPEGTELPWISVSPGGGALAVWTQFDAISVSSHSVAEGWSAPQQLSEQSQLSPAGGVDGAGNLIALWPSSEQITVQRQPSGGEWQALEPLDSLVTVALWSHVDRQGRVNVVWQNGSGIWWTRFE